MWRWIAKQKRQGSQQNVNELKAEWLANHGYEGVCDNCFFCEYTISRNVSCPNRCPGGKVDKEFDCGEESYNWFTKPIAFYNKLCALNRKRKAKVGKI